MANVLIIDDDYCIRTLYQFLFMEAGHTPQVAKDGQEALQMLETFIPDLMLLDISMPVMDGVEFIKELHRQTISRPELSRIPFIVLTGENFVKMKEHHAIVGNPDCKAYLPKMTQQEQVLSLVERILTEYGKM
ncbi:MAG: response regulator [Elusimicrobiales bacterium]|nr:response regulator [Elusimicrobiales bacterium]